MVRLLKAGVGSAFIAASMVAVVPMLTFAQKIDPAVENERTTSKEPGSDVGQRSYEEETNNGMSAQNGVPVRTALPATTEVETQRRYNELRRELLDDRANTIDWWLVSVTIVLAFLTLVFVLGGYIAFGRFRKIEVKARKGAKKAAKHARKAGGFIEEIQRNVDTSHRLISCMTAQTADDEPATANQAILAVNQSRGASLVDRAIAKAVFLRQQGRNDAALEIWQAVAHLAEESDNGLAARAWFSIGYLLGGKSPEESISAYGQAIRLNPDLAGPYNNRGIERSALGRHDEAIADFDVAIRLEPYDPKHYNSRGLAKAALGLHTEAITDYNEAIRLNPDYATGYNNRGNSRIELEQYAAAINDYSESIRRNPDQFGVFSNRGRVKAVLKQYDDAIADFDAAILLNSNHIEAYLGRGVAKAKLGRDSEAYQDLETALKLARNADDAEAVIRAEQWLGDLGLNSS